MLSAYPGDGQALEYFNAPCWRPCHGEIVVAILVFHRFLYLFTPTSPPQLAYSALFNSILLFFPILTLPQQASTQVNRIHEVLKLKNQMESALWGSLPDSPTPKLSLALPGFPLMSPRLLDAPRPPRHRKSKKSMNFKISKAVAWGVRPGNHP